MSRYKNNRFIKNKDGKLHYATTEYVEVPVRNTDLYFIATEGDRCDTLASKFSKRFLNVVVLLGI